MSYGIPWGTLSPGNKIEADWISQKGALFLTKSFELCVGCGLTSLCSGHSHFIPAEGKLCLLMALSGPGKECDLCSRCPEFPVRHPFQTLAWEAVQR